jgi:hypothetical protein
MAGRALTARVAGVVAAPFDRSFWTLKVVGAVVGTMLTVGSGLAQVGIGDAYRDRIAALEEGVRRADERVRTIDGAVFEFKLFESNAALIQVLSANGAIRPELRDLMRQLNLTDRRHAFLVILSELYPEVDAFKAKVADYDRLTAGSVAWDKAMADAMIAMERDEIIAAHRLQQTLVAEKFDALGERDAVASELDRYTAIGFAVTQFVLLIVMFANLFADRRPRETMPPVAAAPTVS